MDTYKQDPPNAIQIEPTEGCSLNCRFCGVQGIRESKGGYKFMSLDMCGIFVKMLKRDMIDHRWNPRIELAMHGEPTMNPDLLEIVKQIGRLNPRELILVTNGSGLLSNTTKKIDHLFGSGLTSMCLDQYDGCDFAERVQINYKGDVPVYRYGIEKFRGNHKRIVIKEDVSHLTKAYDKLNTHCGGGGDPGEINTAIHKRCAKPFRELSIRWDGNVALCCNDFRGVYKIGNIADYQTLEEIWQHKAFRGPRRSLYNNSREFDPCRWCDALSARVGLLPDKYGQKELRPPTKHDKRLMKSAVEGGSYADPVLRVWELESPCLPKHVDTDSLPIQRIDTTS